MRMFLGGTLCLLLTLRKEKRKRKGDRPLFFKKRDIFFKKGESPYLS